ncbi:MAG: PDZ domain-containing protein [Anaerolineae bacterium]|nr:PDZ domain-containing protein [Anaerolineae bacterium]
MSSENNSGWKWAAIILGALLLMLVACLFGCLWGTLIGGRLAYRSTRDSMLYEYPLEEDYDYWPEEPNWEEPLEPESGTAWLGVTFVMSEDGASVVEVVAGSPADEAGIRRGDIIIEVDGDGVWEGQPLNELILRYQPGDRVTLTLLRSGEERELWVRLGERPLNLMEPPMEYPMWEEDLIPQPWSPSD